MKLFQVLYRITVPGGIILAMTFSLARLGVVAGVEGRRIHLYCAIIFAVALILSAVFRRSRLFLASLVIALAYTGLVWLSPLLSPQAQRVLFDSIALLLPLNLVAFSWLKDRGIASPAGERRLALIGLQVLVVAILMRPRFADPASYLGWQILPRYFSDWSGMAQPALIAVLLAVLAIAVSLGRRYRAVENSLLWSLISVVMALRAGSGSALAAMYFGCAGLLMAIAVLEVSYRMAYHDELTGLPSRRALNEALLGLGDSYTIAMLDVDHFKRFNDTYGHDAGDQALQMVASKLAHVAGGGKAYRYGGEEFAVLFPGTPANEAFTYLDRLRRLIEQSPFVVRKHDRRKTKRVKTSRKSRAETNVTVSVGIASSHRSGFTVEQIMRAADQALYRAKARGRNCTVIARAAKAAKPADLKTRILQAG